jgi:hypothetical protein
MEIVIVLVLALLVGIMLFILIRPTFKEYLASAFRDIKDDADATASDWKAVGDDIRKATKDFDDFLGK